MQSPIKLVGIRTLEHHGQIFAVGPVGFLAKLCLDAIEELGSRQGVRNGDSNIIGASISNEFDGVLNILPSFPRISELQEVARPNPFMPKVFAGLGNLLYSRALIHCVQNLLRSRLSAHPHLSAAGAAQASH